MPREKNFTCFQDQPIRLVAISPNAQPQGNHPRYEVNLSVSAHETLVVDTAAIAEQDPINTHRTETVLPSNHPDNPNTARSDVRPGEALFVTARRRNAKGHFFVQNISRGGPLQYWATVVDVNGNHAADILGPETSRFGLYRVELTDGGSAQISIGGQVVARLTQPEQLAVHVGLGHRDVIHVDNGTHSAEGELVKLI